MVYLVHANIHDVAFELKVYKFKEKFDIHDKRTIDFLPRHITLMYGDFSENKNDVLIELLEQINFNQFDVKLGRLELFEENSLVSLVKSDKIIELQKIVLDKLKPYELNGSEFYNENYNPHTTLLEINPEDFHRLNKEAFLGDFLKIEEFVLSKKTNNYWKPIKTFSLN